MESLGVEGSEQHSVKGGKQLWSTVRQAKTTLRFAEPTDDVPSLGTGSSREMPQDRHQKSSRTLWNTVREKKPAQLRQLSLAQRSSKSLLSNSPSLSHGSNNDVPDAFLQLRTPSRIGLTGSTLSPTPSSKSLPGSRDVSFRNVDFRESEEPGGLGAEAACPPMSKMRRLVAMRMTLSRKSLSQDMTQFAQPMRQASGPIAVESVENKQLRAIEAPRSMKDLKRLVMKAGKHSASMPARTLETLVEQKAGKSGKVFSWMKHGNSCAKTFRLRKKEKEAELARQASIAAGVVPEPEPEPEPEIKVQERVELEARARTEMAIDMVKLSEVTNDPSLLRVDWMQKMIKAAIKIQTEWRSHRKRQYWKKLDSLLGGEGNDGKAMMKRNEWGGWEMQEGQDIFAKPEKPDKQSEEGEEEDEEEEGVWSGEDWEYSGDEQSEEEPASEEDPDAEEDEEDYGDLDEEERERVKAEKQAVRELERAARQEKKAANTAERARIRAERKAARMAERAAKSARRKAERKEEREAKKREALTATSGKPLPQKAATQVLLPKKSSSHKVQRPGQGKSQRQMMEHSLSATAAEQGLRKGKSQKQMMEEPSSATAAEQRPRQGTSQKQMMEHASPAMASMQSTRQGTSQKHMMEHLPPAELASSRPKFDSKASVSFKAEPEPVEWEGATEESPDTHDDAAQSPRSSGKVEPLLKPESAVAEISLRKVPLPPRSVMPLPALPSIRSSAKKAIKSLQFRVESVQMAIRSMRKITITDAFSVADFRKWTSTAKWRFALVKTSVMDVAQGDTGLGGKMDKLADGGMSLTSLSNLMEEVRSIQANYSKASAAAWQPSQVSQRARRSIQAKLMQFQTWLELLKEMTEEEDAGLPMLSPEVLQDAPLNPMEKKYFQQKAELSSMRPVLPSKSLKKPGGNPLVRYRPSTRIPPLANGPSDFSSSNENPLYVRGNVKLEAEEPVTSNDKRVIASGGGLQVEISMDKLALSLPPAVPISASKFASKTVELEPPAKKLLEPARARDAVRLPRSVSTRVVSTRSPERPGGTAHDLRRWESSSGTNASRPPRVSRSCSALPLIPPPRQLKQKTGAATRSFDAKPSEVLNASSSFPHLEKSTTRVSSLMGEWEHEDDDPSSTNKDETTPFIDFMREVRAKKGADDLLREHMPPAHMLSQCSPLDVL